MLSNSHFTSRVYARAFPSLARRPPRVVYPCIDVDANQLKGKSKRNNSKDKDDGVHLILSCVHAAIDFLQPDPELK